MTSFRRKHNIELKRWLVFLFALCSILYACKKEDSDINNVPSAWVSMYSVAENAPQLNVFLNGVNVATGLPFRSYTLYNRISPGTVDIKAQSYSRDVSIDTSFPVAVNKYYSLFFTGSAAINPILVHDSFPSRDTGKTGMRFFIFSPGVKDINVYILNDKDSTVRTIGWANRGSEDDISLDSINTFRKFKAGTYSFFVIAKTNIKDTLARFQSRAFADSSNYTLLLEGHYATGDTALQLGSRLH